MPLLAAALLFFMPCTACSGSPYNATHSASDNYFLFSSRVCLKEQLSIFTTQAWLKLPKVARSSHGNSFIPGLCLLARILLNHYCHLTATCVHLYTVDLYIRLHVKLIHQPKWVVCELDRLNNICTYTIRGNWKSREQETWHERETGWERHHKSSIWYLCFWNMRWTVMPQWTLIFMD